MIDVEFDARLENSISLKSLIFSDERGPMAKLAAAVLVDAAENIIDPQPSYEHINRDSKHFVKDEAAVDFWFDLMKSDL